MIRIAPLLLLAACATTRGQPVSAPGELLYRISHPTDAHRVDVGILRVREGPAAFAFGTPGAIDTLEVQLKDGSEIEWSVPASGEVDLPNEWNAVRYHLSMDDLIRSYGATDLGWGVLAPPTGDLVVPGAVLLLRPRVAHEGLAIAIEDTGGDQALETSFPWFGLHSWKVTAKQLEEPGFYVAGGRRRFVDVGRGKLELALLGPPHPLGDEAIIAWLTGAAHEVLTVRSDFPAERALLAAVPVLSNEASPFGRMLPGPPRSAAFLIGTEATADDFRKDWVAVHELLRLALPAFEPRESWLSEGLLAYFTEAARARSGRQTPEQAWGELLDVLDHGVDEAGGMRMEEVIRESGTSSRLRAVTAVGALFVIALDAQLRAASNGGKSLNDVLDALRGPVTLQQFGAQVDAAAGQPIFEALLAAHRGHPAFFARNDLIDLLGVVRRPGGVTFKGPDPVRDAMMKAVKAPR